MTTTTGLFKPAQWLIDAIGGGRKRVKVNAKTTIGNAPFWYGINRISGNIGTLPLNVLRNLEPGSRKEKSHLAYRLLRQRPNRYQTPFVFKQTETSRAILWGNSRSYIHRDGNRSELIPLRPEATITGMVNGEKWHCTLPNINDHVCGIPHLLEEMKNNPRGAVMIADKDCLHIQGFGNGVSGYSLFEVARQSLEVSIGAEKRSSTQMTRGFAGKIMLEAPENSAMFRDQQQAEEFLKEFKEKHGADGAADEIGLLRGGVKASVMQMSNRDSEFIALRKFQRQEAALWLMLESILGDDNSVSYNSEEQKQLAYLKNCLSNWLVRWEEECSYKLLSDKEFYSGSHCCKFNVAALLRTDTATTVDTLSKGIGSLIWNPNEARDKLDENPYEGGDEYGNPAITPGSPGGGSSGSAATVAHLEHLIGVETKRVNEMLARGDSIDKIETWYKGWSYRLGDRIEDLGGDRITAQQHCVASIEYIKKHSPEAGEFSLTGSAELLAKEIEQ